ncbi:sensor histidine kinase [Pelagicoccus sp. SDUM812002]|uniref:sensor histidine kinase n=1 Tax=Pelagicoccus sp. SDUM812002 TaxID=3041266 RepID=UPI00280F49F7|nr:sensor histidine kinase [Pelagicoccus sp. SDUM812002]MDQ8188013.1 sensor histidine kinase [Pelagicoccus sp. SDUM812002]
MKGKAEIIDESFVRDYRSGLNECLCASRSIKTLTQSAKALGIRAAEERLPGHKLVSLHFSELEKHSLVLPRSSGSSEQHGNAARGLKRANRFLSTVLASLDKATRQEIKLLRSELRGAQSQSKSETVRYQNLLEKAERDQERARLITHQFLLAQEAERKEISRELHDQVAQILAGINVRLSALKKASSVDQENLETHITKTQILVEQSVKLVHSYARKLRPAMLDDLGLLPSLRTLIKDFAETEVLNIKLEASPNVETLDNRSRTVLFRVSQEALTNVVRHANAKNAIVQIRKADGKVHLVISDDGKSFNVSRIRDSITNNRLGLLGMRERVEMLGGSFTIQSSPGEGTAIVAEIPLALQDERQPQ